MTDAYIDPDRAAWEAFKALPRDRPIQMLNLIRLRDRAEYPPGHPDHGKPITGASVRSVSWNPVRAIEAPHHAIELADLLTAEGKQSQSAHWYHSGLNYFGSKLENGRIYQAYFFRAHNDVFARPTSGNVSSR